VIEDLERRKYRLSTELFDEAGECVIDGEAVVLIDELPDTEAEAGGDPDAERAEDPDAEAADANSR